MNQLTVVKTLVLAVAFGAFSGAEAYNNFYWRSSAVCGNVGWGNPERWDKDSAGSGVHAVPQGGDVVRLNNDKDARVTDADWETFKNINEIVLGSGANLTLDFSVDREWNGSFQGSLARVVKINPSRFECTRTGSAQQLKGGTFVVSNGTFSIAGCLNYYCSNYEVWAPGVLELGGESSFYMGALSGDGVVYRPQAGNPLVFIGEIMTNWLSYVIDKGPYVFSGSFSNSVPLSFGDFIGTGNVGYWGPHSAQSFTGTVSTNLVNSPPRFYRGVASLAGWGCVSAGTMPSSLGNNDTFNVFGYYLGFDVEVGARYCGAGAHETTRTFQVFNRAPGAVVVLDGGANGGLTYAGQIQCCIADGSTNECYYGLMTRVAFRGEAGTNAFTGSVSHYRSDTNSFTVIKQGGSTWRFTKDFSYRGPTLIERGTLVAATLRDLGESCSLGSGILMYTNYYPRWKQPPADPVPFGQMLGDGSVEVSAETATLAYEGSTRALLQNRPFALRGAGRVSQTGTGALCLTGAYGAQNGANALVLDAPAGAVNYFTHVTNGLGTLKVVKEGAGTWVLNGSVDLADGVDVKAGTLEIASRAYTWHRLMVKRVFPNADCFMLRKYVLAGDEGTYPDNVVSFGLTYNSSANGNVVDAPLNPGEVATWRQNVSVPNSDRPLVNIFQNDNSICHLTLNNGWYEDSDFGMMGIVTRLPANAQKVTCYDMQAEDPNYRNPKKWSLEGSWDGRHWNRLDAREYDEIPVTAAGRWLAADSAAWSGGWPIAGEDSSLARNVAKVQVASGATFISRDPVTASGVVIDAAVGGGTVRGVTYAAAGTIDVTGLSSGDYGRKISFDFETDSGWDNVANWTVLVDGEPTNAKVVKVFADGVVVFKTGMCVLVR